MHVYKCAHGRATFTLEQVSLLIPSAELDLNITGNSKNFSEIMKPSGNMVKGFLSNDRHHLRKEVKKVLGGSMNHPASIDGINGESKIE